MGKNLEGQDIHYKNLSSCQGINYYKYFFYMNVNLFHFRSSVLQQKNVAINTIANLLSLYSTGVYDDILDLPLEQIFFVIRFCLDDNTPTVLNASIKAMRNLFFSQVDEVCLDSLLGFDLGYLQPTLAIDNEMEDDNTVNDQQLSEKNLVKCLARTEIFTRIRFVYILFVFTHYTRQMLTKHSVYQPFFHIHLKIVPSFNKIINENKEIFMQLGPIHFLTVLAILSITLIISQATPTDF